MNMKHQAIDKQQVSHQQRAIPPLIIDWLRRYGYRITGMNGTTVIYFDKASKRSLCCEVGHIVVRRLADMMDAYLVMSNDRVITTGHRFKPLKHKEPQIY